MSDIDTSSLDGDPIEREARRRFEASPFRTTRRTWDELTPDEREPWIDLTIRYWVSDALPTGLGDQLVELFRRYPFLRLMLWTMLVCWVAAGLIWLATL